jgi:outer membrane protein TolC
MKRLSTCLFFVLTVAGTTLAVGETNTALLTVGDLVVMGLQENPELRAARAKWEAMKLRSTQAGALANPMLTVRGMDSTSGGKFPDTNEKRIEIEQSFPWFGKRGLQKSAAAKEAEAMRYDYETMARDTILEVKQTYYDLCAVQKLLKISRDEEAVLQRLASNAESRYSTGQVNQQDVLKAQTEITMLKQKILEARAQETMLNAKLNVLLGRRADAPLAVTAEPPADKINAGLDALVESAETNRAEIARAEAKLNRSRIEKRLMAREYYPDYRIGAEYRLFSNNEPDMVMFMVGVDLPIWQSNYRAGVREAEQTIESNQAALEAAHNQAMLEVKEAHFNLLTARQSLDLYQNTLIPQAQSRFKASEAGYKTGTVDFLDLLESERFLLAARIMAVMAEGKLGMQIARLERAIGTDLK